MQVSSIVFPRSPSNLLRPLPWLQLYVHKHRIDEDLVRSVAIPAAHPAAEEVVFLLLRAAKNAIPLNALLDSIALHKTPLLLLWGDKVGRPV